MSSHLIRRITPEDIYRFNIVSDPAFSPVESSIAVTVTIADEESDGYRSHIALIDPADGSMRRLTRSQARDTAPQWSPDGSQIAFLSTRSEPKQIWLIRVDGGEATRITDFAAAVDDFCWSPDGGSLAVVSREGPVVKTDTHDDEEPKSDVKLITRIRYRSDDEGFLDERPRNIWIVPLDGNDPRQLTHSDVDDRDPVWSPNGREIAFVTNRTETRHINSASEIWTVNVESGAEHRVLGGNDAKFSSPSWSPDGSAIAAIGHWEAAAGNAPDSRVWVVRLPHGEPVNITPDFDRSATDTAMSDVFQSSTVRPIWSPSGDTVYFLASDSGATHLCSVSSAGGSVEKLTRSKQRVSAAAIDSDGERFAVVVATAVNPGEICLVTAEGLEGKPITDLNRESLSELRLSQPDRFTVDAPDGRLIQAWMLKPVDFDPSVKYPMILQIHGGPHGMYADAFMHEFQLMAARGYVVVYCNPRGSSGYGEEFTRASHSCWGEADMPDLMAVVDHVVAQDFVDENRLGVTGGSYGGFMTLWMIGHTDRFKAAVAQRNVSNLYSFYGTSDIGWTFGEYEFDGKPWERREHFMKYSPISYVENMLTPLLLIHSEKDFRCPIEQSEQVFISLQRLGRDVEFVRFPDENHNLSRSGKPRHRIERLEHIIGWFDRHL